MDVQYAADLPAASSGTLTTFVGSQWSDFMV
jgi:hypothetical protein